jgi:hypothetical protein
MGAIYREEEVVVYTYFLGGVKYYKKVLDISSKSLEAANKFLELIN